MFQFSLRSIILVTLIVALSVGAVVRIRHQIEAERSAAVRLEEADCNLVWSSGRLSEHVTELEIHSLSAVEGYNPIADLRFLPNLKRLYINPFVCTEKEISGLQQASPSLQHLTLRGAGFRGRVLSWLTRFPHLKTLRVDLSVAPQELEILQQFTGLTELEISASNFGDAHLSSLSSLTKLKTLELDSTCLTGKSLGTMNGMTKLESLKIFNDVPGEPLDAEFLDLLSAINPERAIETPKTYVNLSVEQIPIFPSLRCLVLQKCELDQNSISRIAGLPCLLEIWFKNCIFPPDVSFSELTRVRVVGFSNCQPMEHLIASASEINSLENLSIEDSNLGFADLAPLSNAKRLEVLVLTDIRNDGCCKRFLDIPRLQHLCLWGTSLNAVEKQSLKSISIVEVYDF